MLSLLFASMIAQAHPAMSLNCEIKETGKTQAVTKVAYTDDNANNHSIAQFKAQTVSGFVAISKGMGVVNLVNNNTQQVVSFYGDVLNGYPIGGNTYFPAEDTWVTVECSLAAAQQPAK